MSSEQIHDAAARGFSVGAATYASGRPDYPREIVGWLKDALALGSGKTVIDLGAGTGKFTGSLVETGARVVAVEPIDSMRALLEASYPLVLAKPGTAEAIPAEGESVDAIVCATAFHWFATTKALDEMRRVLKPGGRLGLIWNVRDESIGWVAALTRIISPYEGDVERARSGRWRRVFPAPGFTELQEKTFAHAHLGAPRQVIVERTLSTSFIAALPAEKRAEVERNILALIDSTPELRGRETVSFPYVTHAYGCTRL